MKQPKLKSSIKIASYFVVAVVLLQLLGIISVSESIKTISRKLSKPPSNVHEATKLWSSHQKNPYSFSYETADIEIIERDSKRCKKCHGDMLQKVKGKPKYPIHEKMINAPMVKFHCTNCHKKVDLGKRKPGKATIRVDRNLCTKCHEAKLGKNDDLLGDVANGIKSQKQAILIANHGTDKKTAKKWVKVHGEVAKAISVEKCRRCHIEKSELDFCNDCHKGKLKLRIKN